MDAPEPLEPRDGLHVDWHCHSQWSDGQGSVGVLADAASKLDVTLGISDHGLRDNRRLNTAGQLAAYDADLARHHVLRGLEISAGDLSGDEAAAAVMRDLDYVIASLHVIRVPEGAVHATRYLNWRAGLYPGYIPSLQRYNRRVYFDAWLRALEATIERWPVRILGHFCLLPELANERGELVLQQDPEPDDAAAAWLDATIKLCVEHNVAIELNSKSRVPHLLFVKRALELGARFSLGSDAHQRRRAGDLSYGRHLARQLKIPRNRLLGVEDLGRTRP